MTSKASAGSIPIVDLGQLGVGVKGDPGEEDLQRVARGLQEALRGVGFVYLKNHGIPKSQIKEFFSSTSSFFNLEEDVKLKYQASDVRSKQHGYLRMHREQLDPSMRFHEFRESYYLKHMDDMFPDDEVPEMRPAVSQFHAHCLTLTFRLLTAMALAIDLERDFFTSKHKALFEGGSNLTVMRVHHYPPLPPSIPSNAIRCGAHTDFGLLTLLFQDDVRGLQVRDASGSWVYAEPIPGTIVVNAGDMLQYWTAGKFVATEHRVIIPEEEVLRRAARQSVAFFIHPDDEVLVTPMDGSMDHEPINARQHAFPKFEKAFGY